MQRDRNRLYALLLLVFATGYVWLALNFMRASQMGVCLFKKITSLPCPSCGLSRSMLLLLQGNMSEAVHTNPLVLPAVAAMLVFPIWILADLVLRKQSFYVFYRRAEQTLRRPAFAALAIVLLLANWLWNIDKHL